MVRHPNNTFDGLLLDAQKKLQANGLETANRDARLLMQHATGYSHAELITKGPAVPTQSVIEQYISLVETRLTGQSVHRIVGYREFFGHRIELTNSTLEPRPETEILVERVIDEYCDSTCPLKFVDIGTGSGAIAIALLKMLPNATAIAVDINESALNMAQKNARLLGVSDRFSVLQSNYLDSLEGQFDFFVSNPPYISSSEITLLSPIVREFDPIIALDGGPDGLDAYRSIMGRLNHFLPNLKRVFFEIGFDQANAIEKLARMHQWHVTGKTKDLQKLDRVLELSPLIDY